MECWGLGTVLNRVVLIGRLTADPELRYTQDGTAVVNFTLAVDRPFSRQRGEKQVDFIRVVGWRGLAESVANNLGKGRLVAVDGRIRTGRYQAQDGSTRYTTDVVAEDVRFLDWPRERVNGPGEYEGDEYGGFEPGPDDDIPF